MFSEPNETELFLNSWEFNDILENIDKVQLDHVGSKTLLFIFYLDLNDFVSSMSSLTPFGSSKEKNLQLSLSSTFKSVELLQCSTKEKSKSVFELIQFLEKSDRRDF